METEKKSLRPGQFNIPRRVETRQKFDTLKSINIVTVDEAISFLNILGPKLQQMSQVLSKSKLQSAFSNTRQAVEQAQQDATMTPYVDTGEDDIIETTSAQTDEEKRLAQLRQAQERVASQEQTVAQLDQELSEDAKRAQIDVPSTFISGPKEPEVTYQLEISSEVTPVTLEVKTPRGGRPKGSKNKNRNK